MSEDKSIPDKIFASTIRDQAFADKYSLALNKEVQSLLSAAQGDIVAALAKNDPTSPTMTKWKQARLETLNKDITKIVDSTYKNVNSTTNNGLMKVGNLQTGATAAGINKAIGVDIFNVTITPSDVKAIVGNTLIDGRTIGGWWNKQSAELKSKLAASMADGTKAIQIGMVEGEGIGGLVKRIIGSKTTPGIMDVSKREAEALVRTSVMQVSGAVRQEMYKDNADVLDGIEVVATLDNRTTPLCRALDGKRFDMNLKPIGHGMPYPGGPPFHWNCRSTIIPLVKSFAELAGSASKLSPAQIAELDANVPIGQRASMHGPVSANQTYQSWLKDQPRSVQEDILGKTRYKLWSENKLDVGDLVTNTGHSLTLKELRYRYEQLYGIVAPETGPIIGEVIPTVVSEWTALTSMEAAIKFFKESFNIENLASAGATFETKILLGKINAIGESLVSILQLPRFAGKKLPWLAEIKLTNAEKVITRQNQMVDGYYRIEGKTINLGGKGKRLGDTFRIGEYSTVNSIGTLTRHEYGHHIWETALVAAERREWESLWILQRKKWWENKVSFYAGTNFKEAFSDSFTAWTSRVYGVGNKRNLPKELEAYFDKIFGKAQVGKVSKSIVGVVKEDLAMVSARVERAKSSHLPATKEVQKIAAENQELVALKTGGRNMPDNHEFDVIRGREHIEVKTIVRAKNNKITMHPESLDRKARYLENIKDAKTHTLVIDERTGLVYYKSGLGSFNLTAMEVIGTKENFGPNLLRRMAGKPIKPVVLKADEAVIIKDISPLPNIPENINRPYSKFTNYDKALSAVSEGGTPQTKKLLQEAIKEEPGRIAALQGEIIKRQGKEVTLYRVTRGRALSGIESFTDNLAIAKEMGADLTIKVPVDAIVGYSKYQPNALRRGLFTESEVLVDTSKIKLPQAAPKPGEIIRDPKSPYQTHLPGDKGLLKDRVLDFYLTDSTGSRAWQVMAGKEYGINPAEQTLRMASKSEIDSLAKDYAAMGKMGKNGVYSRGIYSNEYMKLSLEEKMPYIIAVEDTYRKSFTDLLKYARGNPEYYNPKAFDRTIRELKEEAASVMKGDETVYRGIRLDKDKIAEIKEAIEKYGEYRLPVMPVSSYSQDANIARRFSRYGGTESATKGERLVYSHKATKNNTWIHTDSPTFKAYREDMKKKGDNFYIGGTNQKELVVGHPQGYVILTKENVEFL